MSKSEKLGVSRSWGQALLSLPSGREGKAKKALSWFWWAEGRGAVRTLKQADSPGERALRLTMGEGRQPLTFLMIP